MGNSKFNLVEIKENNDSIYKMAIYSVSDKPDKVFIISPHTLYLNHTEQERNKMFNYIVDKQASHNI